MLPRKPRRTTAEKRAEEKALADLLRNGAQMASLCFTLSRHDGTPKGDEMRELQEAWDAALTTWTQSKKRAKQCSG